MFRRQALSPPTQCECTREMQKAAQPTDRSILQRKMHTNSQCAIFDEKPGSSVDVRRPLRIGIVSCFVAAVRAERRIWPNRTNEGTLPPAALPAQPPNTHTPSSSPWSFRGYLPQRDMMQPMQFAPVAKTTVGIYLRTMRFELSRNWMVAGERARD